MAKELSADFVNVLACPKCKGSLRYDKAKQLLVCSKCKIAFKVENGIPIMLLEKAIKVK